MNTLIKKLLASQDIKYLEIDQHFIILEVGTDVDDFAEIPEQVKVGGDARQGFPELIGLEGCLENLRSGRESNFKLESIARFGEGESPFYLDIYIARDRNEATQQETFILCFEDSTERSLIKQAILQHSNEAQLLIDRLSASQQYIDTLLESMADALIVTTPSGQIKTVNKAALNLFEYSPSEFANRHICDIIPEANLQSFAKDRDEPNPLPTEASYQTRSGKTFYVSFSRAKLQTDIKDWQGDIYIGRDITERRQIELALSQTNGELKLRNQELKLLNELSQLLNACVNLQEAEGAVSSLVPALFPNLMGGLYVIEIADSKKDDNKLVRPWIAWGDSPHDPTELFPAENCWALRRGRGYLSNQTNPCLRCQKICTPVSATNSCCVPMIAQGEALGFLHLCELTAGELTPAKQQLAFTVTEHLALALANLKLQELLQRQSNYDALTGLYNRRYFDRSLEREISLSEYKRHPLSAILIDIDHFKHINDTYGHEAGDEVLRELGVLLQKSIRDRDRAYRYGGEEFVLILQNIDPKVAQQRSEQVRQKVKQLRIHYQNNTLSLTISCGIACFPEHGSTGQLLLQAADRALRQAKKAGRDRAVMATETFDES